MKKPLSLLLLLILCLKSIGMAMGAIVLTDPTRPPGYVATGASTNMQPLAVTAIFTYPNFNVAIINGKALKIGDHIDEFTITAITSYTVELIGPQNIKEVLTLAVPLLQPQDGKGR